MCDTIEDEYRKVITVDGRCVLLAAVDNDCDATVSTALARADSDPTPCPWLIRSGIMVLFSISDRQSFDAAAATMARVRAQLRPGLPMFLLATKCDAFHQERRAVTSDEGLLLAASQGAAYWEVSAMQRINVSEAFLGAVRALMYEEHCDALVRKVVVLVAAANRFDKESAFARLPRDVLAMVLRRVWASRVLDWLNGGWKVSLALDELWRQVHLTRCLAHRVQWTTQRRTRRHDARKNVCYSDHNVLATTRSSSSRTGRSTPRP